MKVFYFRVGNGYGGLENFAINLISEVVSIDPSIEYTIIVTDNDFSYREEFLKLGCKIALIADPHRNPLKFFYDLKSLLKQAPSDSIVQLNICTFRNGLLFKACKESKLKTIVVGHYTKVDDGILPFLHRINSKKYSKNFICVSNSDDVSRFMFPEIDNPVFIDNGISQKRFKFSPEDRQLIRNKYGLSNFVIGQIGRICDTKNQLFSVKVVEKLNQKGFDCQLVLVGKEFENDTREYVEGKKIENIHFIGPVYSGIEKFYSAFDVCLLPSKNEGMSLSLLESASNGVDAIFSTDVPQLKVECDNLTYLELNEELWAEKIIEISKKEENDRKSPLRGTVYDLTECAKSYIHLYKSNEIDSAN